MLGQALIRKASRLVAAWPALSTIWLEYVQAFGRFGGEATNVTPVAATTSKPTLVAELKLALMWAGLRRCGRIQKVMASRAPTKVTSVVAIAGTVRRMSVPAVSPSAKANAV